MREGANGTEERIIFIFRTALGRLPSESEKSSILNLYNEHLKDFSNDNDTVTEILSTGESAVDKSLNAPELASWTMIIHLILNLSEIVTKG